MEADYCISLAEMGFTLQELTKNGVAKITEIPGDIVKEARIAERVATGIDVVEDLAKGQGEQGVYSCPDCGGVMWNISADNMSRYRCHVGHSYSESDLVLKQAHNLEATLWVALRMMEERKNLLNKLAKDSKKRGAITIASGHEEKGKELQQHIDKLKEILFLTQESNP
jgi:two-component system chemotaxis response regulator CheB